MDTYKIAIIVGSLRKESYNLKTAKAITNLAPQSLSFEILQIGNLPFYNEDIDGDTPPQEYVNFRQQIRNADGFIFVTPEYNRSVPAVLKNAIDVGSRPYGQNSWDSKPGAVISVSMSALGGFGANHHLRQSLVFVNVPTMQQPEAYIGNAHTLFSEDGQVTETTSKFLKDFMEAYEKWVISHSKK